MFSKKKKRGVLYFSLFFFFGSPYITLDFFFCPVHILTGSVQEMNLAYVFSFLDCSGMLFIFNTNITITIVIFKKYMFIKEVAKSMILDMIE